MDGKFILISAKQFVKKKYLTFVHRSFIIQRVCKAK